MKRAPAKPTRGRPGPGELPVRRARHPAHHVYRSSSMVQVRGSIPLYWHHINLSPAPDIVTEKMPPASARAHGARHTRGGKKAGSDGAVVTYPASRAHFKRLYERYGARGRVEPGEAAPQQA